MKRIILFIFALIALICLGVYLFHFVMPKNISHLAEWEYLVPFFLFLFSVCTLSFIFVAISFSLISCCYDTWRAKQFLRNNGGSQPAG